MHSLMQSDMYVHVVFCTVDGDLSLKGGPVPNYLKIVLKQYNFQKWKKHGV